MTITSGVVRFERTVKTGDFENKKAAVELTFTSEDGKDYAAELKAAASEAHGMVHKMLGIKPELKAETAGAATTANTTETDAQKEAAAAALATKDKAEKAAAKKAAKDAAAAANTAKPADTKPADAAEGFDETFDENGTPGPEITDQDLSAAMNRQVGVLKPAHGNGAATKIKELIAKFVEPPKKSADIPQASRQTFLNQLKELK